VPARRILGAALVGAGKPGEAVAELAAAAGPDRDDRISLAWLAHAKALAGEREEAGALLASLESSARTGYVPGYHLALAHLGLGDRDAAFGLLEKACADREPSIVNLRVEPRFEPLRRDPRYGRLLERLRLPD
jgi:hypothetical protein